MKTSVKYSLRSHVKTTINSISLLCLAPLILMLGVVEVGASPTQSDILTNTTPATPAAANPAQPGTAGANAAGQTVAPNNPPSRSIAEAQDGGNGGDGTGGAAGGKGGKGGSASAIARATVPGIVQATAVGGSGGTGGTGSSGGGGGNGGDAKAEALGMSTSASAVATGGLGGMGVSSSPRGGATGNGGNGGNASAVIDVQESGTSVVGTANGGAGGGGGLGIGGGKKGFTGNGGSATVDATVMATGANDVTINLTAAAGKGGPLGGSATNSLEGSTTKASATLIMRTTGANGTFGPSGTQQSGNAVSEIDFTAQKNLTIDSVTSVAAVGGSPANPAGIGGNASSDYELASQTGNVSGTVKVVGGPVVNSRMGQGGNASGEVTATAAGNINLEEQVAAGWGGRSGGNANSVITGTSPKGTVELYAGARSGSGDSTGTATAKATGTGKSGSVEAQAVAGTLGTEPQGVKKPVGGVKAVTADAKAPVKSTDSAISQARIGTATPSLAGLTGVQATSIATGSPLSSDVFSETASSPNVLQQVVEGSHVLGMAGLGASYPGNGSGQSATYQASADFDIEAGVLNPGSVLKVGLFNPTFTSSAFDQITFDILDNGKLLEGQTFASETQARQFFSDDVLKFNSVGQSSGDVNLDFEYSFTAHQVGSGFGFGLVFSVPDQGGLETFMLALGSLAVARWGNPIRPK
jgi:hypothetical protein